MQWCQVTRAVILVGLLLIATQGFVVRGQEAAIDPNFQVKATSLLADENLQLKEEARAQDSLLKALQEKVAALESANAADNAANGLLRSVQADLQEAQRLLTQERARAAAAATESESAQSALKIVQAQLAKAETEKSGLATQLEAAKAAVEEQAGKGSDALLAAEQKVLEVQEKLAAAEARAASAEEKLAGSEQQESEQLAKARAVAEAAENARKAAYEKAEKAQEALDTLQREVASLKRSQAAAEARVATAESNLHQAESRLQAALKSKEKAEAKAAAAERRTREALAHAESWLPVWAVQKWQALQDALRPHTKVAQKALGDAAQHLRVASQRACEYWTAAYETAEVHTRQLRKTLQPHLTTAQKKLRKTSRQVMTVLRPHLATANGAIHEAVTATQAKYQQLKAAALAQPKVQQLQKEAATVVRELERLLGRYLRQHPQLAPYAKKPAVTYLVYAALAAPLVTVLLPLLAWLGSSSAPKPRTPAAPYPMAEQTRPAAEASPHGESGDENQPPRRKSGAAGPKKRPSDKSRRLTVGEDSIRVP